MNLVILYGLPASRKLTVGKELERLTGYRLFHNHLTVDLVESIFPAFNAPHFSLREAIWTTVFEHGVRYGLPGLIFTMVFHRRGTPTPEFFPRVEQILGGKDRLLITHLLCDLDEVKRRVTGDSRKQFGKPTTAEDVDWFLANRHYEPDLSRYDPFEIDNTHLGPEQVAAAVAAHFQLPSAAAGAGEEER